MIISERLRTIRLEKDLSQGDIEQRTGLKRCYVSRVENGHTVPSIETLEKIARALEIPLYQIFYDGEEPPKLEVSSNGDKASNGEWGASGNSSRFLHRLRHLLGRLNEDDRKLLFYLTFQLVRRRKTDSLFRRRESSPES
jgi:transcriptional regulator with XRE-family HTH domain